MFTLNTSLMVAEHDLHSLDEFDHESDQLCAMKERRSQRRRAGLTRVAQQVKALFV